MATSSGAFAHIGKSVSIKGDVSGSEDVYVDGQLEGSIQLNGNSLTLGPNGKVRANVVAKNVTISGQLNGNIQAMERTDLRKTAVVNGDVQTRRIAIEEGAYFNGRLEILPDKKVPSVPEATVVAASSTASPAPAVPGPKK
ncbi:MAG TPA: polymer-forming cytoskeletal protein [Terriglobales bacterium]|nr:polymer-forming cytoskeletal protein [Terriglobales bacterium]